MFATSGKCYVTYSQGKQYGFSSLINLGIIRNLYDCLGKNSRGLAFRYVCFLILNFISFTFRDFVPLFDSGTIFPDTTFHVVSWILVFMW